MCECPNVNFNILLYFLKRTLKPLPLNLILLKNVLSNTNMFLLILLIIKFQLFFN